MKLVSKTALTGALGVALALGGASSAVAQKKEKPAAAAPGPQLSKAFRAIAAPAQAAIKAAAWPDALTKLDAMDAVAVSPDEKFIAAQFRYQVANASKDVAMQAKAIDAMIASGGAPASITPQLYLAAGNSAYQANNYPRAIQMLTEAQRLGNKSSDVLLLLAEANFKQNQVPAGLVFVEQAVAAHEAAGTKAPKEWYARAASVAYKAKLMGETSKWTRAQVKAYPTVENWRSALVIYRDSGSRDSAINLDLFRLMRVSKAMAGERDYFEYAALASERGLPGEAKAVIDEGLATSAVPTASRPLNELRTAASAKIAGDRAGLAASEKSAAASATGRTALATADAYLGYGDDAKAVALYRLALTKGGIDADAANTRLGIALARSGQKDAARTAFTAVTGARAELAQFWLLYLDQMGAPLPAA